MIYDSNLSIEENARKNNLSQASVRKYIKQHKINRREEEKANKHKLIQQVHENNPEWSARQIAKALKLSPTTVNNYLKKEITPAFIDFMKIEEYEGGETKLIAFSKGSFKYNGESIGFGNMRNFPIRFFEEEFFSIETIYIACAYGKNDKKCIEIQREIQKEDNALKAKRKYRNNDLSKKYEREDFHNSTWHFNLMLYLVWQKCLQHKEFADILLASKDRILIEDQSRMNKVKQGDWGMKNDEAKQAYYKYRKAGHSAQNSAIKAWNKGKWRGMNHQGKILMACRQALKTNSIPPIDFKSLNRAEIYLFGKKLVFN